MLWLIYEDYIKQDVRTTYFVKYLKWHVWVISISLLIITLYCLFKFYLSLNGWILFASCMFAAITGSYFGNELKKSVLGNVGDGKDIFDHNIISIRNILKRHNISHIEQIDLLINQINEELPELKMSEKVLKAFYTISTALLLPIITLMIKWLLNYNNEGVEIVIILVLISLAILGIFYIIKPLLEEILDSPYRKMSKLKRILEDIKLVDFLK